MIETKDNVYEVIRKNLRYYRKLKGMTQAEFAEAMNLSHDYVRQVESKKSNKNFSISTLQIAAQVLDIKIYQFFEDKEDIKIHN